MSYRGAHTAARDGCSWHVGYAYVLLEEARLRCEDLIAHAVTARERSSLGQIHRELGMAGWIISAEIESGQRLQLLAGARDRSRRPVLNAGNALASAALLAEDALTRGLAQEDPLSDQLQLAHLHLLDAEALLHDHLAQEPV
jgi:hypothetical protein